MADDARTPLPSNAKTRPKWIWISFGIGFLPSSGIFVLKALKDVHRWHDTPQLFWHNVEIACFEIGLPVGLAVVCLAWLLRHVRRRAV